jgi:glycosyltransferase involved in cell wall biosynthesis
MRRILYVVTHPVTAKHLLRGQLRFMQEHGYDVTVAAAPGPELALVESRDRVRTIGIPMSRAIGPWEGPAAMWRLTEAMRRVQPDIVNASTAKAGLLGMLAAAIMKVPNRVYLLRGLRLEGTLGALRGALGVAERLASASAQHVVCVSESLRLAYTSAGYAPLSKTRVIPSNGVDTVHFSPRTPEDIEASRRSLGLPSDAIVVGFVGRIDRDKGMTDLLSAFEGARAVVPQLRLLVVGGDVAGDRPPPELSSRLKHPSVSLVGVVEDPAPYYPAMDFLVLPSYREGLPNVPLEAGSCEVPTIGYRSTGIVDAVDHGHTGRIVDRGNLSALGEALVEYANDPNLRRQHGKAARKRVLERFANAVVWKQWLEFYASLPVGGPSR